MLLLRRILVPTDHSACAESAYATAFFLARQTQAEVRLLHVPAEGAGRPPAPTFSVPDGVVCTYHVRSGERASAVIAEAAADADLVVMGTHGRAGRDRLALGRTTEEVIRQSDAPMWVVGPAAARPDALARVLVPVDFGETAATSLHVADAVAALTGATVEAMHAVYLPPLPSVYGVAMPLDVHSTDVEARVARSLRVLLQAHVAPERRGEAHVSVGPPAATILETARTRSPDLLVLATHGRSGRSRLVLGSVAESVLRHAPCGLLALKPSGRPLRTTDDLPVVFR